MRPLIAVVTDRKPQTAGAWIDVHTDGLPHSYVAGMEQAGAAPILIPPIEAHIAGAERLLDRIDGLFLAGGRDIDASLYGQSPHPANDPALEIRDRLEILLTQRAVARGVPVFGACRGLQVINVAFGGTLEQHLADRVDLKPHRDVVGVFTTHRVGITAGTLLSSIVPGATLNIASHHHQAVAELGDGLVATAFADDGVIEAIEAAEGFCIGVQWHPEAQLEREGHTLMRAFVESCCHRMDRSEHVGNS